MEESIFEVYRYTYSITGSVCHSVIILFMSVDFYSLYTLEEYDEDFLSYFDDWDLLSFLKDFFLSNLNHDPDWGFFV